MEKLQSAIEKARQKRAAPTVDKTPDRRSGARRTTSTSALDKLWLDIPQVQPSLEHLDNNRIVTLSAGKIANPFDILRTKILLLMRQNNWTRLAVTSPTPGSGKTTMACNLALGLGRQQDLRAMLLDLDLRKPHAARALGISPPHCISELLTGGIGLDEQAVRVGSNVALCLASKVAADPTSILLDAKTETALEKIQDDYKPDLMIFDLPPVLVSDDTRAFLNMVDCALIVTRANKTSYGQFDRTENEIAEHTNVLGVVLNGSGNTSEDEDDYYGY